MLYGIFAKDIMKYKNIVKGRFISRQNRFIAKCEIDGREETVHVKNTGRLKELLICGCNAYFEKSGNPNRKTAYDLIAIENVQSDLIQMVNIDSQIANAVAEEWLRKSVLFSESAVVRREVKYGGSRFDLYIEDGDRKAFMEVKGVTLRNGDTAMFPDAPTQRGVKHIKELITAVKSGYEAYILFVIQMKGVNRFTPNAATHKDFATALTNAKNEGVNILAVDCMVTKDAIEADKLIDVIL